MEDNFDNNISDNFINHTQNNNTIYIILSVIFLLIITSLIVGSIIYYKRNGFNLPGKSISNQVISSTEIKSINISSGGPLSNKVSKENAFEIDCSISNISNILMNTCSDPLNTVQLIQLIDGPIVTMSSSTEVNSFDKKTIEYYIIVPYEFIVTYIISVANKEIVITTLEEFQKSLTNVNIEYSYNNKIPDKCMGLSNAIRTKSSPPYNTTCIFFKISTITALSKVIEKSLFPFIPISVLNEYFNVLNTKINNSSNIYLDTSIECLKNKNCNTNIKKISSLTILEYTMYLALINLIKSTNYKYFTQCTVDDDNNIC